MVRKVKGIYIFYLNQRSKQYDLVIEGMVFVGEITYGKDFFKNEKGYGL